MIWNHKILIPLLMLLQIIVCIPFITSFPIALDEPFSIFHAQLGLKEMLPELSQGNNAPLHFILLNGWTKLFGISPFAVRSLSVLFGVLAIYPLYKISQKLMNDQSAILVVALFIFSRLLHFHFMEARMYGLFITLFLFILYDLYLIWQTNKFIWWRLGLMNAALFATHYLGGVIIGLEVFFLLLILNKLNRKSILFLLLSFGLAFLLVFPIILDFITRLGDFNANGTWVERPGYSAIPIVIFKFFNNPFGFIFTISFSLVVFLIHRNIKSLKENWSKLLFFFYWSAVPFVFFFYFSRIKQPIFLERYMLFIIPVILILVVYWLFLQLREKRYYWISFIVILPFIAAVKFKPNTNRDPEAAVKFVKSVSSPNSSIAIFPAYYNYTFIYHYNKNWFNANFTSHLSENRISSIYSFEDIRLTPTTDQLILIESNGRTFYPNNNVIQDCMNWGIMKNQGTFVGGLNVYVFERKDSTINN